MLCAPCTCTGEYSKAKRAEDTPQIDWINLNPAVGGSALLLEALWDWRDNMWDDASYDTYDSDTTQLLLEALWDWRNNMWDDATQCASYDSYDSDTTQIFDETYLLVVIPPWPPKLPCGHEFVSIK